MPNAKPKMLERQTPPKPDHPCHNCGSNNWWLRDTGHEKPTFVCGRCHPHPQPHNVVGAGLDG